MQDKDTTKSTFIQLFEPILSKNFYQRLKDLNADKYVKKLKTTQLIELISLAQIEQQRGLRDIGNSLNNEELSSAINLESISASQVSRRLRDLPTAAIQELFKTINLEIGKKIGFEKIHNELGRINLIDSSTISMCLSRYPWAEFRKTKSGVKLHLRLRSLKMGLSPIRLLLHQPDLLIKLRWITWSLKRKMPLTFSTGVMLITRNLTITVKKVFASLPG